MLRQDYKHELIRFCPFDKAILEKNDCRGVTSLAAELRTIQDVTETRRAAEERQRRLLPRQTQRVAN